ncbi:MATE family efflux transporter [Metabacillus arenae]|uniref:MATE family efflux transporter n=1 Tax=Metabacillus arenae TaxID=2771434 RepID=A0A926NHD7_9BACI|nr:MATE family efflux transporter [Metabacillus arenae]MBD1380608.1 MATE family efflux transporter [Metabacillus arenae]
MKKDISNRKLTLFALTWPIFIELFLHMLMGNADTLMLSQYSDDSVAAVGVANQILNLIIVMFGFIATGTTILIAQSLGANQKKEAIEISYMSIAANFISGLFIGIIVFLSSNQILKMMDLPIELIPDGSIYLKIVGGLSVVQALIMTIGAVIRSYGFTRDTMYVTIGMNIINVIGNYLFIFGPFGFPVLGVQGVAISTVVSRVIGLIVITLILVKRVDLSLRLKKLFTVPIYHLKNLLKIGIPSAGEHLSYNTSQMVITFFVTMLGAEALTTKVYAQNLMMFIFLFSMAISQGTQILIGHHIGARDYDSAYKRCMRSLYFAIALSIGMGIVFSFFSEQLFSIFTDSQSIISVGSILILLTIILEPGRAFNMVIINSLRAAGDVKFPVYVGILSMWGVGVPIAYYFGIHLGYGLVGVWLSFIADEWLRGILMYFRWKSKVWVNKGFVHAKSQASIEKRKTSLQA